MLSTLFLLLGLSLNHQPIVAPDAINCDDIERIMDLYKTDHASLTGDTSNTLNALVYDGVTYYNCPVTMKGASSAYTVRGPQGQGLYWIEQTLMASATKDDAIKFYHEKSAELKNCYPAAIVDNDFNPASGDDYEVTGVTSMLTDDGYFYEVWIYIDVDATMDALATTPVGSEEAVYFRVLVMLGKE
jgi:hypothetical protein